MSDKIRLDAALVERGLAPSRDKARALIMAGEVLCRGQVADKPDKRITSQDPIEIKRRYPYVSRGAFKIQAACTEFGIEPYGLKVVDIGISTGGFCDFMLQKGAARVTGVDVNIRQVDDRLNKDDRVELLEKNARYLAKEDFGFVPDLFTIDVSFISVLKILPALAQFAGAKILAMIKPQFEAERGGVGKGGVVREQTHIDRILAEVRLKIQGQGFRILGVTEAGIKGRRGNQEYFFLIEYGKSPSFDDKI